MRYSTVSALCSASFAAIAIATPAFAQTPPAGTPSDQCATIADEAQKQACLEKVSSTDPANQEGDAATIPPGAAPANEQQGQIVVTGSRLRRSEFNSPDPISIINPQLAEKKGQNEVADMIHSSPLVAGSTQITSAISTAFVTEGGTGAQTVSLRGLGANRTLVLLNGRRAGPAGVSGQISSFDLNVIPSFIVNSFEILKSGASSIYGSDAVAGVINILTKRDTDGIQLRMFGSKPQHKGGGEYDIGAAWGKDWGTGHVLLSADYYNRQELRAGDRSFLNCSQDYLFNDQGDRIDTIDPRTGKPACQGIFNNAANIYDYIDLVAGIFGTGSTSNLTRPDGTPYFILQPGNDLGQFLPPLIAPTQFGQFGAPANFFGLVGDNQDYGLINQSNPGELSSSVIPKTKRLTLYGEGSIDLSEDVEAYTELLYNNRKTTAHGVRNFSAFQFTGNTLLPLFFCDSTTPYCDPSQPGDPINSAFSGDVLLQPVIATDHAGSRINIDYYRGVGGVRGKLGRFNWDVFGQYSLSDGTYKDDIIFQDAIDTFNFRTQSCAGTVTSIRGVPCIDINLLDPRVLSGTFTPEEEAFLFGVDKGRTKYRQMNFEGTIGGDLIQLPAGPLRALTGLSWRRDAIRDVPGEITTSGNSYSRTSAGVTAGHQVTKEAFAEIEVPILRNAPLTKAFTLSGAARLTDVKAVQSGTGVSDHDRNNWTYKVGANWETTDWLRFRGVYSTSFRSPALYENFLSNQTGFQDQINIDPCLRLDQRLAQGTVSQRIYDNCIAAGVPGDYLGGTSSAEITSSGGIGVLDPETSTNFTLGAVFTPKGGLWRGMRFSLAADYFDIKVKGEITQLGPNNILFGCYNSENFPTDPLCDQFVRDDPDAQGGPSIISVADPYLNIASQRNKGVDVTARLNQALGRFGDLSLVSQMTWQLKDNFLLLKGTPKADNNGEVGDPKWVGDFDLTWSNQPWTFVYGLNVIGHTSNRKDLIRDRGADCFFRNFYQTTVCPKVKAPIVFYHSVSLTREIGKVFDITLGVANLLDRKPPRLSTTYTTVGTFGKVPYLGTYYDYIGRRFFININAKFGGKK